jgi:hypothetical protein
METDQPIEGDEGEANIADCALSSPGGQDPKSIPPCILFLHFGEQMIAQNAAIPGSEERNFAIGALNRIGALVKAQFSPTLRTASRDPGWLIQMRLLDGCLCLFLEYNDPYIVCKTNLLGRKKRFHLPSRSFIEEG